MVFLVSQSVARTNLENWSFAGRVVFCWPETARYGPLTVRPLAVPFGDGNARHMLLVLGPDPQGPLVVGLVARRGTPFPWWFVETLRQGQLQSAICHKFPSHPRIEMSMAGTPPSL